MAYDIIEMLYSVYILYQPFAMVECKCRKEKNIFMPLHITTPVNGPKTKP